MSRQTLVGRPAAISSATPSGTPSSWSLESPSTWPKWLIALVIGVPLTIGGAYWLSTQQRRRPGVGDALARKGRTHLNAGDSVTTSASKTSVNSPPNTHNEPKTVAERIAHMKNEGNKLFRAKRYMDAKKCYTEVIDLAMQNNIRDMDLAQSLQNRAACNEQLKHPEDVIADCTAAIQIDKHYAKAYARRSRGRERLGYLQDAVYDLVSASILTSFQNNEYRERSEKLLNQLSAKIAKDIMEKRRTGHYQPKLSRTFVRQFNHGFNQDPIKEATAEAMASDSDRPIDEALRALANSDYDNVINLCTEAISSSPESLHVLPRLLRGTMYFLYGNTKLAKVDFNYVIASDEATLKEKSNARIKLACLSLQEQVDPESVMSRLNEAVQLDPSNSDIWFHKAQCYMLFNQFDDCLKDFRKCRDLQGNNDPTCTFHIAHIEYRLRMQQDPMDQRPLAALEEQISRLDSSEAYVLLGQLYLETRDFEKAQMYYNRALLNQDDSHKAVVFTQQAMLEMMWHEDKQAAEALLEKALAADPNYSAALELMMDLELQSGNIESAKRHYERCLELAKSEVEMVNIVQAYQIGEAGQFVYADLGIEDQGPPRAL